MKCVVSRHFTALLLVVVSAFPAVGVAHAHVELPIANHGPYSIRKSYTTPNETHPQLAQNVYALARNAQGGLLSVGTERGFMVYAAMATPNTHLVLIDIDPVVTRYNLINIGLLALSKDLEDYLSLRRLTYHAQLLERFDQSPLPLGMPQRDVIMSTIQNWYGYANWIENHSEYVKSANSLTYIAYKPQYPENSFFGLHYPSTPHLYETLKQAALQGLIHAGNLDLSNTEDLDLLRQYLYQSNIKLSLIDLSNVPTWWSNYNGQTKHVAERINNIVNTLSMQLTTESYVLSTQHYESSEQPTTGLWRYSAFSTAYWRELKDLEDKAHFAKSLVEPITPSPKYSVPPTTELYLTPTQTAQQCEQKLL